MSVRMSEAQAQSLGLIPTPKRSARAKTHTTDGHLIDQGFVGIAENGRDSFQSEVMKLAKAGGWTCGAKDEGTLGGLTYHAVSVMAQSERGWPDLTLIRRRDRRLIFAELKREAGEVTPRQVAVLDLLRCLENPWSALSSTSRIQVFVWRPSQIDAIREVLR